MRKQLALLAVGIIAATGLGIGTASTASAMTEPFDCGVYSTSEPLLGMNSSGDPVKALQCELNTAMTNTHLDVDGDFGTNTYKAVIRFQACGSLKQDGLVGPKTWALLDTHSVGPYLC
jgi:peptidoglycan hydrolase-like protein with peptidoglycan-binding domain